jgi:undecaprenyl-diphosphatase
MDFWNIILLSIIQGLSEFLPISSSGHLILAPLIFNFEDQGLALDAIMHLGTLLAILIYFRKDLFEIFSSIFQKEADPKMRRLAWNIIYASIPASVAGLLFADWVEHQLRSHVFVAGNLIFWSLVFLVADRRAWKKKSNHISIQDLSFGQVLFVGFAQAMALLPGTSRSGVTIAAGLTHNLSHKDAARFSFLLGTPIIFAAGMYQLAKFLALPDGNFNYDGSQLMTSFAVVFIVGYASIPILFKIVAKAGLLPFVVYRLILATAILLFYPS